MQVVDLSDVMDNAQYTIKQVCALLKCHRNSLRNWTDTGKIKVNFGKFTAHKFYYGKDIKKFYQTIM